MWVQVDGVTVKEGNEPLRLAPPGAIMDEGIYAVTRKLLPTRGVDGVVPIPGRDPLPGGQACYWLTGTVGNDVRDLNEGHRFGLGDYRFLVTVGSMRFVGTYSAKRRHSRVEPGTRVTLECSFLLVSDWDWDMDDLPDEWSADWRVLHILERSNPRFPTADYVMAVEPAETARGKGGPDSANHQGSIGQEGDAVLSFLDHLGPSSGYTLLGTQPFPLLLHTNDGSGPLWYRDAENKAAREISLDSFPLSKSLHDRLLRWATAGHHLHHDDEEDDHQREAAWHKEGRALLAELRSELGPDYDVRLSHDVDA
jgi:hypothetical protein